MSNENAKILVVAANIPPAFGGGALRAYRYAARLHQRGSLAGVVAMEPPEEGTILAAATAGGEVPDELVFRIPRFGAERREGKIARIRSAVADLVRIPFRLYRILRSLRRSYTWVHCFGAGTMMPLWGIGFGKWFGKKVLMEMTLLGNDDPRSIYENDSFRLKAKFRLGLFSKADVVVSKSPALTKAYIDFGMPPERLCGIPNPVDTERFCPPQGFEKRNLREELEMPDERFAILFVGGIIRRKGLDILVEAFRTVARELPHADLWLVGPDDCEEENGKEFADGLKRIVAEAGLSDRVFFTGSTPKVPSYLRAADLFVFPSRSEGLPNVVLEAMASGIPTLVTRIPGITDYLVEDGEDGIVVPGEDPARLAEAIVDLAGNGELREALSKTAVTKILTRFSNEVIDRRYRGIYES